MTFEQVDFEAFVRQLNAHPEWLEALQERIVDEKAILRLLDKRPEMRDAVRQRILHEEFLQLPALVRQLIEAQQRHEMMLQEHTHILQEHTRQLAMLIETQQRHEAILQEHTHILQEHTRQLAMLIETQQRHEAILQEHTHILQEHTRQLAMLIETQQRHETLMQQLVEAQLRAEHWRLGEDGRRRGEQLERMTLKRAPNLFNGGQGGSPEYASVRRRLSRWLRALGDESGWKDAEADPMLADIIWWKGDRVIVGEVSALVDLNDVNRALRRAETLRRAGVNAIPFVLGDDWATFHARERAEQNSVEWFVRGDVSRGFIEFRRLPWEEETEEVG